MRTDLDEGIILNILLTRLIDKVDEANEDTAWIDDAEVPAGPDIPAFQECFTIVWNDAVPDLGDIVAGQRCTLLFDAGVTITHMKRFTLDQPQFQLNDIMATTEYKSMMRARREIVIDMTTERLASGAGIPWEPKFQGQNVFADPISVARLQSPRRVRDWPYLRSSVDFRFAFRGGF